MIRKKSGLSPVVATTLLVSVALVLAIIIFLWARSFVAEQVEKNGQAIETLCEDVSFVAEAHDGRLWIENTGTIPIYSVEMRLKGEADIKEIGTVTGGTIGAGQTGSFPLPSAATVGDTVIAIPILLGETETERVPKVCDEDYGIEAVVGA